MAGLPKTATRERITRITRGPRSIFQSSSFICCCVVRGCLAGAAPSPLRKTQPQPLHHAPCPRRLPVGPPARYRPPHGRQLLLRQRRLHPRAPPPPPLGLRHAPPLPARQRAQQ